MNLFSKKWRPRNNNFLFDISVYDVNDEECNALVCYIGEKFHEEIMYILKSGRYEFYTLNDYKKISIRLKDWVLDRTPSQIVDIVKTLTPVKAYHTTENNNGFPKILYYKTKDDDIDTVFKEDTFIPTHVYIFHHFDHDGIISGRLAYDYYVRKYINSMKSFYYDDNVIDRFIKQHITLISIKSYATILKDCIGSYGKKDKFIFVDYSFSNAKNIEWLKSLYDDNIAIEWIDHHATSIKLIQKNEWMYKIRGIISETYSASLLSYLWYRKDYNIKPSYHFEFDKDMNILDEMEIPKLIKYVDSYDTWKHYMDKTVEFHYGFLQVSDVLDEFFDSNLWWDAIPYDEDTKNECDTYIDECINKGASYLEIQDNMNKSLCNDSGFDFKISINENTYSVFALNTYPGSRSFDSVAYKYDIVMPFSFNGTSYSYSMYNDQNSDLDLSVIAEALGGGGHPHACGFTSPNLMICKDMVLKI